MIELINVKKQYKKRILFENISLKIEKPGIYAFIGDNGAGKTTLLNIINKNIKIDEGKVINKHKSISFVSQKVNLIDHLTIKEHLDIYGIKCWILKKYKLYSKLNSYPKELSLGQKQRVAFIIGLYSDSTLLLLDEPTSNLDEENSLAFYNELKKISRFKTILLVSHDVKKVYEYSDCVYKIDNRKLCEVFAKPVKNKGFCKKSTKLSMKNYINKSIKYNKKINFIYVFVVFVLMFLLFLTKGINHVFNNLIKEEINYSLDYNKFYLKECDSDIQNSIVIKKCHNLSEEKLEELKEYKIDLNLDLLINSVYNSDKFSFISQNNYILEEGDYPSKYNEIITDKRYSLGDIIQIKTSKVIAGEKTDIYSNTLILKVVGIAKDKRLLKEDKYYLDYDLFSSYLKEERLLNNKTDLYSYFKYLEVDNYKYVIYFDDIDLNLLKDNNISYVSSSYEYYASMLDLNLEIKKYFEIIEYLFIPCGAYYFVKVLNKKMKLREKEILFLKANMMDNKKIIVMINKENNVLIVLSFFLSFLLINIIVYLIFHKLFINYFCFLVVELMILFDYCFVKSIVNRRVNI